MAHYSFINEDNLVVEVITGKDEYLLGELPDGFTSWEEYYETKRDGLICKRTSKNTYRNQHSDENKEAFRGNFAGVGMSYDPENDVFIAEKPFDSWIIDESIWDWKAPVDIPDDANDEMDTSKNQKMYLWNEDDQTWDLVAEASYNETTKEWEAIE